MRYRVGAATDVGRARERNEDSLLAAPPLYAVADGMGGHRGGNVASELALQVLSPISNEPWDRLADQVKEANRAILERAKGDRSLSGMGTTLTAAFTDGEVIHLAHVGDSRAYLFRDGELHQLTEDHTLVHRMAMEGKITQAEEETHPQRSILIRALGVEEPVDVDEVPVPAQPGDRLLLCSDGLHSMVPEEDIKRTLESVPDPQDAAEQLVEMANRAGGLDNVTVIILDLDSGDGVELADRATRDSIQGREPKGATGAAPSPAPDDGGAGADITRVGPALSGPGGGRADDTAVMPSGVQTMTAPRPTGPSAPPPGTSERTRKRRRRLVWWVVGLAVLLGAAIAGLRLYLNTQWFVGVEASHVAVFRGIPSEFVGIKLYGLVDRTELSARSVEQFSPWRDLADGITVSSEAKAELVVATMRSTLSQQRGVGKTPSG